MAESLTSCLLWTLAVLGAWNLVNLVARYFYDEMDYRYGWSIIVGAWSSLILILR